MCVFVNFFQAIPLKEAAESSSVVIAVTPHGGHIGFLDGIFPRYQTYMDRVYREFVHSMFTNRETIVNRTYIQDQKG